MALACTLVRARAAVRAAAWTAFYLVCNVVGVETFRAAVTAPPEEALLPRLLSVPLIGLTALGAVQAAAAWRRRRE